MTFAHPNGAARPARIRILGATPPPPPPRRGPSRPLLAACVVVAALGVGITLLLRPQISEEPSPTVAPSGSIDLMGLMNLGARMPDQRALRVMGIDSPDFDAAARIAAAREHVVQAPYGTSSPTTTTTAPVESVPAPATRPNPATGTGTSPTSPEASSNGPDQPPNPATPNFLDQS